MNSQPNSRQRFMRNPDVETAFPIDNFLPDDRMVAALFTRLDQSRRVQSSRMELGTADLRILWLFSDNKPRTLKEIATELCLEQSTVNRQVNAAMAEGFLKRSRRHSSAAHEISRTTKGVKVFEDDVAKSLTAYASGLDALGDRVDDFLADLARFAEAYDKAVGPDSQ